MSKFTGFKFSDGNGVCIGKLRGRKGYCVFLQGRNGNSEEPVFYAKDDALAELVIEQLSKLVDLSVNATSNPFLNAMTHYANTEEQKKGFTF